MAEQRYTHGRAAAATLGGPFHSVFAAKKGKKLRTTGRVLAEGTVGGMAGRVAGTMATKGNPTGGSIGYLTGSRGAAYHAFRATNKKGYYKKQPASKFKKNDTISAFGVDHD